MRVLGGNALTARPQRVSVQHTLVWEKPVIRPMQAPGAPPEEGCPPTSFSSWCRLPCLSGPWEDVLSADPVTRQPHEDFPVPHR